MLHQFLHPILLESEHFPPRADPGGGQEGQAAWAPQSQGPHPIYTTHIHVHTHKKSPKEKGQAPAAGSPGTTANESLFRLIVFQNSPPSVFSSSSLQAIESAAYAGHAARWHHGVPCATGPTPLPAVLWTSGRGSHTEAQSQLPNMLSADCSLYTTCVCYHVGFNFQFPNFVIGWTSGVGF
jgi:hypothetical protein